MLRQAQSGFIAAYLYDRRLAIFRMVFPVNAKCKPIEVKRFCKFIVKDSEGRAGRFHDHKVTPVSLSAQDLRVRIQYAPPLMWMLSFGQNFTRFPEILQP